MLVTYIYSKPNRASRGIVRAREFKPGPSIMNFSEGLKFQSKIYLGGYLNRGC